MRWCKVVEILPVMRRTAPPDQLVPDKALVQQLPGHPVGLSQVQGGVEVEERQQLFNQLRSPPKDLCSFTLSQRHLLSLKDPQREVNLECYTGRNWNEQKPGQDKAFTEQKSCS